MVVGQYSTATFQGLVICLTDNHSYKWLFFFFFVWYLVAIFSSRLFGMCCNLDFREEDLCQSNYSAHTPLMKGEKYLLKSAPPLIYLFYVCL